MALHSFHPGDIAVICELFTYVVQYTARTNNAIDIVNINFEALVHDSKPCFKSAKRILHNPSRTRQTVVECLGRGTNWPGTRKRLHEVAL